MFYIRDPHRDPTLKVNAILVTYALEMLNTTTFNIYQSTYGFKLTNSNIYNGVVGDLQTGRAEISGNVLFMYVDRIDVVDYIIYCCHSCLRFIYKAPPLSYVSNLFKLPFTSDVWYSCIGLIVIISITAYIIATWEVTNPVFKDSEQHNNIAKLQPAWFDIIMMQLGAITQQGAEAEPKSSSGRMVFVVTFISILFLYTAYTANIVALLQSTSDVIKNSEDLVNSGIGLGIRNITFVLRLLAVILEDDPRQGRPKTATTPEIVEKTQDMVLETHRVTESELVESLGISLGSTSTEPITKAVYQKVSEKGRRSNIVELEEGMERVRKEFFAFQTDPSVAYGIVKKTYQESEKCDLRQVRLLQTGTPHITMRKHSPYKEIVKVGLTKLLSSGIQQRLVARVYNRKPQCKGKGGTFASAAIMDCYAAYLIFGIGLATASIILLVEIYFHMKLKMCHNRWKHVLVNKISIKTLLNKYN
ncbi:glutamate receptor 1-like [Diabrotica virgifera virgifera]|uniref:Ionotropic glutamate receptor C-terminal domain-containing protein n=1 Tax=Diabrotica virgifera virgifera TaxID=50390 RepID=A0ABM5JQD8_DIAVI|nr:glutamate receptor 1-like [Diabrotica virgifera virgifera]